MASTKFEVGRMRGLHVMSIFAIGILIFLAVHQPQSEGRKNLKSRQLKNDIFGRDSDHGDGGGKGKGKKGKDNAYGRRGGPNTVSGVTATKHTSTVTSGLTANIASPNPIISTTSNLGYGTTGKGSAYGISSGSSDDGSSGGSASGDGDGDAGGDSTPNPLDGSTNLLNPAYGLITGVIPKPGDSLSTESTVSDPGDGLSTAVVIPNPDDSLSTGPTVSSPGEDISSSGSGISSGSSDDGSSGGSASGDGHGVGGDLTANSIDGSITLFNAADGLITGVNPNPGDSLSTESTVSDPSLSTDGPTVSYPGDDISSGSESSSGSSDEGSSSSDSGDGGR